MTAADDELGDPSAPETDSVTGLDATSHTPARVRPPRVAIQGSQAQTLGSIGRLAGVIAHDYNNLLFAIGGYTELLLQDLSPANEADLDIAAVRASVSAIAQAAERAVALNAQLLAFSQRHAGSASGLDLTELLSDIVAMTDVQLSPFDAHLEEILAAPADDGRVESIVRRPAVDAREILDEATLDEMLGLVGDRWADRDVLTTPSYLSAQVTVISTRVLAALEPDPSRWPLAGDQLYVDLDLGVENLPAGTRLAVGSAVIEVSETPHTGCSKFSARFGGDAQRWVNSATGRALRMRGLNARVIETGVVRPGDRIRKV